MLWKHCLITASSEWCILRVIWPSHMVNQKQLSILKEDHVVTWSPIFPGYIVHAITITQKIYSIIYALLTTSFEVFSNIWPHICCLKNQVPLGLITPLGKIESFTYAFLSIPALKQSFSLKSVIELLIKKSLELIIKKTLWSSSFSLKVRLELATFHLKHY